MHHYVFRMLAFATFVALIGPPAQAQQDPGAMVASLYRGWFAEVAKERSPYETYVKRYFSKELQKIYTDGEARAKSRGDDSFIDFDIFLNAQDYGKLGGLRTSVQMGQDTAIVRVSFLNFGKTQRLVFDTVREGEGWRVDNIQYPASEGLKAFTLRSLIAEIGKPASQ
jgi:hypothetical protein